MNFLTYLENISKANINILHSDNEKHFCVRDAAEMLEGMTDGLLNYPILAASLETGDVKELSVDNGIDAITSGFLIVDKCEDVNDYQKIMQIFDTTKKIGLSIVSRMMFDKSNGFPVFFSELLSVKHKQYGPVFDNCYGTLFTITYNEEVNLLLDKTDWNDNPEGQNINYSVAFVHDSIGNKITSLSAGDVFKIPKHKIVNQVDGNIIAELEFNEDYSFDPGQKATIVNSVWNLIKELSAGETYSIPRHNIKKQDGTLVIQHEFDQDFIIQNTIIHDNGNTIEVPYLQEYTCSTLQERLIFVDFSEGKTINITINAKNAGIYKTINTTLSYTVKKNNTIVNLPFTLVTGDILTIEVTTNGTLELGGTNE